jgi:hypothetical protein
MLRVADWFCGVAGSIRKLAAGFCSRANRDFSLAKWFGVGAEYGRNLASNSCDLAALPGSVA